MDDDQLVEQYLDTLETTESEAGGDTVTGMATRPFGVKDTLGVDEKLFKNDPRGLAKAVVLKNIEELKRMKVDWENLPDSMKFNSLDMQFNLGSLNRKAPEYYKALQAGNFAGAAKESLDAIGAYDPKRKGERPTKGIAIRRAMFYNIAANELDFSPIQSVSAKNLNNKAKSARIVYKTEDGNTIPIRYKSHSLHSTSKPGSAVITDVFGMTARRVTETPQPKQEVVRPDTEYKPLPPSPKTAFPVDEKETVYTMDYKGELPNIGDDVPVPPVELPTRDVAPETTDAIPTTTTSVEKPAVPEERGFLGKAYDYLFSSEPETEEVKRERDTTRTEILRNLDRLKVTGMNEGGLSTKEQMDSMMSPDDMMMPKEPVTKEKLKSAAKELGTFAAEMIPGVGEEMAMQRVEKALAEGDNVGAGFEATAGMLGVIPGVGDAAARVVRALKPKKTVKAYKLFTRGEDGNLYPLFVDADTPVKQGEYLKAIIPDSVFTAPNGKKYVPSRGTGGKKGTGDSIKIPDQETRDLLIAKGFLPEGSKANSVKAVALRPGWHAGDSPAATHIGNEYKGQKYRGDNQVWAEVEMPADIDWQSIANKKASKKKDGTINVKTAQITEELPSGGYYRYKTNPNMQGNWLISGEMKVNRILEPDEVKRLNKEAGTADLPTLSELKAKQFDNLTVQGVVSLEARTAQSQAFRQRLLDSKDEMKKYAAEREISVEEMSSLIKNNYKNNKEILEDVREYMATDSFKNKQKTQKEKGKSLSFKNLDMAKGGVTMDDYQFAELELNKRQNFAEGGMAQQMEMFADGGLNDEGGMVDEESGNEVPSGSLREEVRDDIPANLSEGEFVFPADVVRYIGLEKLMEMRQKAKAGLARMEAMGQMGNADEATLPDDIPFDMNDLDMEDEEEYNQGELDFNVGGVVPSTVSQYGTYTTPSQFAPVTTQPMPPVQPPVLAPVIGQPPAVSPNLTSGFTAPTTGITPVTSTGGGNVGFTDLMPTTTGRYDEMVEYVNSETGERRMIPFVGGKPIYPIPEGFVRAEDTDAGTTQPVTETTTQDDGGGGRDDSFGDDTSGTFANFQGFDDDPDEIESDAYRSAIIGGKTEAEAEAIAQKARKDAIFSQSFFGQLTENISQGLGNFSLKSMFDGLDSLLDFENPFTQDMARSVGLGSFDDYMKASSQTTDAFAGSKAFGVNNPDLRSASLDQGRFQVASITPGAIADALVKEFGGTKATYNDMAIAGNSAMKQALGSLGFVNRTQLMDQAQASLVGKAMSAAHTASRKGQDVTAAVNAVLNSKESKAVQDKAYATIKDAYSAKVGRQLSDAEFSSDMRAKAATYANRLKTEFSASALGTDAEKSYRSNVVTDTNGNAIKNRKTGEAVLTKEGQARKTGLRNALAQTTAIADNASSRTQAAVQQAAEARAKAAADAVEAASTRNDSGGYDDGGDSFSQGAADDEAGDVGIGGGGYGGQPDDGGDYDDSFAKGGLATQMKQGGLASKK